MNKIYLPIPVPKVIINIIVYFLLRYRKKHFGFAFRRIKLTKDKYAIIDPDDYRRLSLYDWHLLERKGSCYAAVIVEGLILYMHRLIMNAPKGSIVDHRNHNGLDNRKANLRFATRSQNCCNKKITKRGTSKYRGVSKEKDAKKFRATIYVNRENIPLGYFENEADAARAYDAAAKKYHGDFAMLNFPDEPQKSSPALITDNR